jgi:thiamine-phosphate pyrophosphorylase
MRRINDDSLYLVISEEFCGGKDPLTIAEQAIAGGVDIIQMREKHKSRNDLVDMGHKLAKLCKDEDVLFIVNDDPLLAKIVGADGVHLGQDDLSTFSIEMARDAIGPDRIIGVSTHSVDEFKKASASGFDYLAYGPLFKTKTKPYCIGTLDIGTVMACATKPVFFIGGITMNNIDQVLDSGGRNVGLIRAITESKDITKSARELKEKLIRKRETVKK